MPDGMAGQPPRSDPAAGADDARVTVFAPNLALSVTLEREGSERERVHFHPAGQGVPSGCVGPLKGTMPTSVREV